MLKSFLITIFVTVLIFLGLYLGFLYLSRDGITDNLTKVREFENNLTRSTFELPIQSRNYKVGLDLQKNMKQIKEEISISDVVTLNISIFDFSSIDKVLSETKADINIVINLEDDLREGDSSALIKKLGFYLESYKQIKYVSIGNSVNLIFRDDNKRYSLFISEYSKIYDGLKQKYPNIKIYTIFQYESLLNKGGEYFTNKNWNQMKFFDDLASRLDFIGLNTLPMINYKSIDDIPNNYFEVLNKYGKKIILDQIAWPSRNLSNKEAQIYFNSSETDQSVYLKKLTEILSNTPCELLTWAKYQDSLDEVDLENYGNYSVSVGFKDTNNQEREIYKLWRELKNIQYISVD